MFDNCHDILSQISDYVEGGASAELCAELQRHLAGCDNCRIVVDTLGKTITLYHSLPSPDLPDAAQERLWRRLHLP
jgi:anti-sigma factor RsiW